MDTDFENWSNLKKALNDKNEIPPYWNIRDVWWLSLGLNIGHEQNGKGEFFKRPVLVINKFNKRLFWGVRLTTQIKDNPHYHHFELNHRKQCALLTQMRLFDASRMTKKMARLGEHEFEQICKKLKEYIP